MIHLENFAEQDFGRLIEWVDSEESLVQFAGPIFSYPLTPAQLSIYLQDPNRKAFKVRDNESGKIIGHAELYLTSEDSVKICRVLIGEENFRGKGLGRQIVRSLIDKAFQYTSVRRIELNVYDWNKQAIQCYLQEGFQIQDSPANTIQVKGKVWYSLKMTLFR